VYHKIQTVVGGKTVFKSVKNFYKDEGSRESKYLIKSYRIEKARLILFKSDNKTTKE